MTTLAVYRDSVLDTAEGAGWPEAIVEGLSCVRGDSGWITAVELATGAELIALARALKEHLA